MRFYSLNIKAEGHLLLPKIAWFLMLRSKQYNFVLGDVNLGRVVYLYCKGMWLYHIFPMIKSGP